jgi:dipeptidyl aminopeptidase/acylaminoacyl peptidase
MWIKRAVRLALFMLAGTICFAQQTGVVLGNAPLRRHSLAAVEVPRPRSTCESSISAGVGAFDLPEMVFSRVADYLVCLRHSDGKAEEMLHGGPWMKMSPDGDHLAYWIPEKHELHVFSIVTRTDAVVDVAPGANMREIAWSGQGRLLAYALRDANAPGIRVVDMQSGKRSIVNATFSAIVPSPDTEHIVVVTWQGVERIRIADGQRAIIVAADFVNEAAYSRSGALLGMLVSQASTTTTDDNEPDCTGGTSALLIEGAQQPLKIPFPPGFDNVLDFAFSPDDRAVAVTFGAAACDYPGDLARVYIVTLADQELVPLSPADRLSVKAQWSPDAKTLVYSDYSGSDSGLAAVDVQTGKTVRLTAPTQDGPDEFLGWR